MPVTAGYFIRAGGDRPISRSEQLSSRRRGVTV
jgi:hypothetical protein